MIRALAAAVVLWSVLAAAVPAAADAGSLQDLIDRAPAGSTVTVPSGTHRGAITIDRPLRVVGEPGATIDGEQTGSSITIDAPDVELANLTVVGSGRDQVGAPSGILVTLRGDRAFVHDVRVEHSYIGVTVQRATDVVLERVTVIGEGIISGELHATGDEGEGSGDGAGATLLRGDGIWLYDAPRSIVRACVIDTVRDGIYLSLGSDQLLEDNTILDSRYAVHDMYAADLTVRRNRLHGNLSGLVMMYGGPVLATANVITDSGSASTGFGAIVKDVGGVTLDGNVVADNRVGLDIDDAGRTNGAPTMVVGNTIALNQVGVLLVPSADATFTRNAFIENTTQVVLHGTGETQAAWSLDDAGNYWSDYGGFDARGDGTGDLPYVRSGRTAQLIAANPLLLALASGPAFRLLMAVEDRWAPAHPTVDDPFPQTAVTAPALGVDAAAPRVPLWIPGLVLLSVGIWLLAGARRRMGVVRG